MFKNNHLKNTEINMRCARVVQCSRTRQKTSSSSAPRARLVILFLFVIILEQGIVHQWVLWKLQPITKQTLRSKCSACRITQLFQIDNNKLMVLVKFCKRCYKVSIIITILILCNLKGFLLCKNHLYKAFKHSSLWI